MSRHTRSYTRIAIITASAALLIAASTPAYAEDESSLLGDRAEDIFAVGFDALVLRPMSIATLVVGATAFVPAALVTWPGGSEAVMTAWDIFVVVPYEGAFGLELGQF